MRARRSQLGFELALSASAPANGDPLTWVCFSSTKEKNTRDEIVVEMKTDAKTEESVLLKAVNGDKKDTGQQMTVVSVTSSFQTARLGLTGGMANITKYI